MSTAYVGVDVGLDGGLCVVQDSQPPIVVKMPTITVSGSTKKAKREVDFHRLRRIFVSLQVRNDEVFVMIERPGVRPAMIPDENTPGGWKPNQGISSQINFVGQWRELRGLLLGLGIAQEDVHASTWKADVFRGQADRGKDAARRKAAMIFPSLADHFKFKNSDGIAEAALLADYARRRRGAKV